MKIRLALTLTIRRDPSPTQNTEPTAPDVDEKGCADLERRKSYHTTGIGFQPSEVQA